MKFIDKLHMEYYSTDDTYYMRDRMVQYEFMHSTVRPWPLCHEVTVR